MFKWGAREVIAGAGITKRFDGAQIGRRIKFGGDLWTVVGVFDADGSGFDSEIWGDLNQVADAFKRSSMSTITFRMQNPDDLAAWCPASTRDNRLQYFIPKREKDVFRRAVGNDGDVHSHSWPVRHGDLQRRRYHRRDDHDVRRGGQPHDGDRHAQSFGLSATQHSAGVSPGSLWCLSFAGGLAGLGLASLLQFFTISTLNFGSFSELAFSFALSPSIIANALGFSLANGPYRRLPCPPCARRG